ncbi:MAG: ABC transporter substrate-binding protein [Candidatus Omnitrophica bacterium]|nr:ABC transporter substrate-binding protein [Candidatus Omnitrophota bacterium]
MRRIKSLYIFCLIMCIFTFAGCTNKSASKKPIKISLNVWPGYAIAYLAQEKGIFKKNNVAVELVLKESTAESLALFTDGDADGCLDIFMDAIMINAKGIPAIIVSLIDYSTSGDVIIGRPEIQSLSELKGKTVSFEGVNTFSHIFVVNALEKAGVEEDDLKFENINAHDVLSALDEKRIDAGHTWEPTKSRALKKGYKILAKAGDYPGMITDVLLFTPTMIKERPEDIQAIIKSLFEAQDYLNSHKEESILIMADKMKMSKEEMIAGLEGLYQLDLKENMTLLTTKITTLDAAGKLIMEFYLNHGQLSKIIDIKNIVERKFIVELSK